MCDSGNEEWILDFSTLFDDLDCPTVEGTIRFSGAKNYSMSLKRCTFRQLTSEVLLLPDANCFGFVPVVLSL